MTKFKFQGLLALFLCLIAPDLATAVGLAPQWVPLLCVETAAAAGQFFVLTMMLLLLYIDQRYGGTFFDVGTHGSQIIWQHTVWLFGRPEIYLLTLPALGAASDIVATHARRRISDRFVRDGRRTRF